MALKQKLADDNPAVTEFRNDLAQQPRQPRRPAVGDGQAVGGGGRVPQGDGDPAEAGRRQPRRHRVPKWTGQQPQQPRFALSETGKPTEAEAECRTAIAILRKLVDDDPKVLEHREFLAQALSNLGGWLLKLGRPAEALDAYERAITLLEQLVKENPANKDYTTSPGLIAGRARAGPPRSGRPRRRGGRRPAGTEAL